MNDYRVNVYDKEGRVVYQIAIDDVIEHVDGRVSKGNKGYYKGVGIRYYGHFLEPNGYPNHYQKIIRKSDVFYMGDKVFDNRYSGLTGIFQEKYQPQFQDFIGTCGVKELSIIENSLEFERSSVEVLKSTRHDVINNQYYFLLDYKCKRKSYLRCGTHSKLSELLEYMIDKDWNFIWDKNSITDVSYDGMVTDVADLFVSKQFTHKLGTIYSVLISLSANKKKFNKFLSYYGLFHKDHSSYLYNSLCILKKLGVEIPVSLTEFNLDMYHEVVGKYLIKGKNCGDCSLPELGDKIREQYRVIFNEHMKQNLRDAQ